MKVERREPEQELTAFEDLEPMDVAIAPKGEEKILIIKLCSEDETLAHKKSTKTKSAGQNVNALDIESQELCLIAPDTEVQFVPATLNVIY